MQTRSLCNNNNLKLVIIADAANSTVEEPFEANLRRASPAPNRPKLDIAFNPLLATHHCPDVCQHLTASLNTGHDIALVMLGVPNTTDYAKHIHNLLDAWADAKKPQLLFASPAPELTLQAVDSWPGWEKLASRVQLPVETLKKAVRVNEKYLVSQSSEDALTQILEAHEAGKDVRAVLASRPGLPVMRVQRPTIEGMIPTLQLA